MLPPTFTRSCSLRRPAVSILPLAQTRRSLLTRKGPPVYCKTAEDAVSHVKSGNRIYVHGTAAVPALLLKALRKRADSLSNVEFTHLHIEMDNPCDDPSLCPDHFYTNHFFVGAHARKGVASGTGSYIPVFLSEVPRLMRSGRLKPDVAFLNLSPPDRHGYCSLGVEVAAALPAAETAPIIIAQINRSVPRTHGMSMVHIDSVDYAFECNDPLPQRKVTTATEVETQIGKNIAELVPDGACLQMGIEEDIELKLLLKLIGAIPNAVLRELKDHKDLGIHTEMFEEGAIDLIENGAITNLKKTFLPGKLVTSFVMGTDRVYNFVNDNPTIAFLDSSVTNNPVIIGSNKNVVAINSAIEVDVTGQVCADSVGTKHISGVGGQIDFERGAALSEGGIPIICLPSLTKTGASRIVPTLKVGAGVITTRPHVHWVVTEYGAVDLFGKNIVQRARLLIGIAHPKHREALEKAALERFGSKAWNMAQEHSTVI
ncbi:Carnitine O-acetyltransferase mitochondrial [Borealophlyctis nickersoniae]|nr:Carnitine O-acetyltransferase mitochondrial [Borealophlyctis nickersoniae]